MADIRVETNVKSGHGNLSKKQIITPNKPLEGGVFKNYKNKLQESKQFVIKYQERSDAHPKMRLRRHGYKKSLDTLGYKLEDDGMDTGLQTKRQEAKKGSGVSRSGSEHMITVDGNVMGHSRIYLEDEKSQ
jgi:hypothetical protein